MTLSEISQNASPKLLHLEEKNAHLKKFQADVNSAYGSLFQDYCQNKPQIRAKTLLLRVKSLEQWDSIDQTPLFQRLKLQAKNSGYEKFAVELHNHKNCAVFHHLRAVSPSTLPAEAPNTPPFETERKINDRDKKNKGKKDTSSPKKRKIEPTLEKNKTSVNLGIAKKIRPELIRPQTQMFKLINI